MKRLMTSSEGATAIEWALLASLIGIVLIIALVLVQNSLSGTYQGVSTKVQDATAP